MSIQRSSALLISSCQRQELSKRVSWPCDSNCHCGLTADRPMPPDKTRLSLEGLMGRDRYAWSCCMVVCRLSGQHLKCHFSASEDM